MKTLICFLSMACFIGVANIYSQENDESGSDKSNPKSWGLQFLIGSDFTLNSFQGTTISLKKNNSDRSAFRVGLSLNGSSTNAEGNSNRLPADTVHSYIKNDNTNVYLGLNSQYIMNTKIHDNIKAYYGAGPTIGYSYYKTTGTARNTFGMDTLSNASENRSHGWNFGVTGVFGVEWMVTQKISLIAEYNSAITYYYNKQNSWSKDLSTSEINKTKTTTDGYNFNANNVKFGVTVYFN